MKSFVVKNDSLTYFFFLKIFSKYIEKLLYITPVNSSFNY